MVATMDLSLLNLTLISMIFQKVTTTGNASLDSTIQEAIKGGKTQLEEKLRLLVQHLRRHFCQRQYR